jgi:hypothetical protein
MVCIAAFIVLGIISIFSAKYRKLAGEAWSCTAKRITLRPCDSTFKEDVKNSILSKVLLKAPKLLKVADAAIEIIAAIIVILTIWSVLVATKSLVNLYVYGTCNPSNASSCSLNASEACSANTGEITFTQSVAQFKELEWAGNWFKDFGEGIAAIPSQWQYWSAKNYLPQNVTYYNKYDSTKPTALEVIDPGCSSCKKLFVNIKDTDFLKKYNLAYIAYPIKSVSTDNGYRFKNSLLIAKYLESIRVYALTDSKKAIDWKVIDRIYSEKNSDGIPWQTAFDELLDNQQAKNTLNKWLSEFGYTSNDVTTIEEMLNSQKITNIMNSNRDIVENKIKTVQIPTIIYNGHKRSGVLNKDQLN